MPDDYTRIRKRIEVIFSQLVDQMNIRKNYAKSQAGYFARIISKITLFTLLQFINSQISRSLNHIHYTLAALIEPTRIFLFISGATYNLGILVIFL